MIIHLFEVTFTAHSIKWGKATAIIKIKNCPQISCCVWRIEIGYIIVIEYLQISSVISNVSGVVSLSVISMYVITIGTTPYFRYCYCFRTAFISRNCASSDDTINIIPIKCYIIVCVIKVIYISTYTTVTNSKALYSSEIQEQFLIIHSVNCTRSEPRHQYFSLMVAG